MPSATDFLPSSMTEFMNLVRTMSPNFGSGRISRFSGRRRRDILSNPSLLQPGPEPVRGLLILFPGTDRDPAWTPASAGVALSGLAPASVTSDAWRRTSSGTDDGP